jgi:hypothetical protein
LPNDPSSDSRAPYSLPDELLHRYHSLLDRRFDTGLSETEENELAALSAQLDEADMATPLEQINAEAATEDHVRRMEILNHVIGLLGSF